MNILSLWISKTILQKKCNISNVHYGRILDRLAWVLTANKKQQNKTKTKKKKSVIHIEVELKKDRTSLL